MVVLDKTVFDLAERLGEQLVTRGCFLAAAESCTGGELAACITDVPGSSAWFDVGFVVYSNAAKQRTLGVPEAVIAQHGAVSQAVVEALVRGIFVNSEADVAVSISGVAGPSGGSLDKPVGTVWLAFGLRHEPVETLLCHFSGDRASVRQQAVRVSLMRLMRLISD
ncbi:MAG: CinA family protein [Gammaproteobacteria bacterium]